MPADPTIPELLAKLDAFYDESYHLGALWPETHAVIEAAEAHDCFDSAVKLDAALAAWRTRAQEVIGG